MAGKSWPPGHEPSRRREREQAPITLSLIKQWKREGKGRGRTAYDRSPNAPEEMLMFVKMHTNDPNTTMLQCSWVQEHMLHARIEMPLTTEEWLVLLVVNSVKLHLTASNVKKRNNNNTY